MPGRFGAIEQAGFHEILRQCVLRTVAIGARQIGSAQQVLVDPHGALVFAAPSKQVTKREMKLGGIGILLDGLDERIDRLVVLLVEQQVEPFEIGARRVAALTAPLAADPGAMPASRCRMPAAG